MGWKVNNNYIKCLFLVFNQDYWATKVVPKWFSFQIHFINLTYNKFLNVHWFFLIL